MSIIQICDQCKQETRKIMAKVINMTGMGEEHLDFCSYNCLADWAIIRRNQ